MIEKLAQDGGRIPRAARHLDREYWDLLTSSRELYRAFITKNGCLGLGSVGVAAGDTIALSATGEFPFVIREVGTKQIHSVEYPAHILLGVCYVEGRPIFEL